MLSNRKRYIYLVQEDTACTSCTKVEDVESNPGPTTHTNTLQSFGCVTSVTNKKTRNKPQSDVTTHTQHTLGASELLNIKQRHYKPDWRCTIHTPTQNVTTTPSTDNTNKHHPPTRMQQSPKGQKHRHTSNQNKRHQKPNRGTKKTQYPTGHHHGTEDKTHT